MCVRVCVRVCVEIINTKEGWYVSRVFVAVHRGICVSCTMVIVVMLAVVLGALLLAVCCCLNKASEVFLMHAYPSGCRGVKARNVHVSKSPMHMHIMPFIWHQVFPVARNQGPAAVARNQAPLAGIQAPLPQLRYALYVSFLSAWPLISMTDTVKFSPSGNLVQR